MPPSIHVKVTEEQLGRGRLLVVGDIHGCRDELLELLEKANYTHGLDNLVLAGDLVDKGPYPIEVRDSFWQDGFYPKHYLEGICPVRLIYHFSNGAVVTIQSLSKCSNAQILKYEFDFGARIFIDVMKEYHLVFVTRLEDTSIFLVEPRKEWNVGKFLNP